MSVLVNVTFWSIFAVTMACMEIESEGRNGWAAKAPTWYRVTPWYAKLYGVIMSRKPLTGYHLFVFFMTCLVFHAHFALGVAWSVERELMALAMYCSVCPMWDYHWFVLNPWYHGKFNKGDIWWHAKSHWVFGKFPIDYLIGILMSLLLATCATRWTSDWSHLATHMCTLVGFAIFTGCLHLVSPLYRAWYWHMRREFTDERLRCDIRRPKPPPEITLEMLIHSERLY